MSYEVPLTNQLPVECELIVDKECQVSIDYNCAASLNSKQCREWAENLLEVASYLEFNGR